MTSMQQPTLDRIRVLNKHVTNKLLIHISGKDLGLFARLTNTGRKSGKLYRNSDLAVPMKRLRDRAYLWQEDRLYENAKAKGGCTLRWKNQDFASDGSGFRLQALPGFQRRDISAGLRMMGI